MATTFRQLLNRVLVNLGEDEIAASATEITETYHKLVRNIINHVLTEVQDAHNWSSMRKTCTATVSAGSSLSSAFQYGGSDISTDSRLARIHNYQNGQVIPVAFDVTDSDEPYRMNELDAMEAHRRLTLDDTEVAEPADFSLDSTANAVKARISPRPIAGRSLQFQFFVPQALFEGDDSDIDTTLNLPSGAVMALELGSTWYAMEERGEELGPNSRFSEIRFNNSLLSAIARDDVEGHSGDNYTLVVT